MLANHEINLINPFLGWCEQFCLEDNKPYLCPAAKLKSEDELGLSSSDNETVRKIIGIIEGHHTKQKFFQSTVREKCT